MNWLVQEISNGRSITYVQHPDHAGPLAKLEDGRVYHYVTDHLGTPQELHDAQGKVVWAAEYSAYGIIRKRMAHEVGNPIRFAGQYFDDETGLHYNRFRYYDPQAGRYVNQDPIGLKGGINFYAYVKGNPVRRVDPRGLFDTCLLPQSAGDCGQYSPYMHCVCKKRPTGDSHAGLAYGSEIGALVGILVITGSAVAVALAPETDGASLAPLENPTFDEVLFSALAEPVSSAVTGTVTPAIAYGGVLGEVAGIFYNHYHNAYKYTCK